MCQIVTCYSDRQRCEFSVIHIPSLTMGLLERELREICPKRDSEDDRALEENRQEVIDNNARTLIIRLSSSAASTGSATRPGRTRTKR